MPPPQQDAYLRALQDGKRDLGGVPSDVFFEALLAATLEGFFGDPVHGGNRDMAGWKLVGFPGAYANYYDVVDRYNVRFEAEPIGMDAHRGHAHRG